MKHVWLGFGLDDYIAEHEAILADCRAEYETEHKKISLGFGYRHDDWNTEPKPEFCVINIVTTDAWINARPWKDRIFRVFTEEDIHEYNFVVANNTLPQPVVTITDGGYTVDVPAWMQWLTDNREYFE